MIFRRWKFAKNRKGITLVEMIAAIAITAILASVLSMMIIPVINTYRKSSTKAELQVAVTARLNDIAHHLRGATNVFVTSSPGSFPDITKGSYQYEAVRHFQAKFGFAIDNVFGTTGYRWPELKWADYTTVSSPKIKWASEYTPNLKLDSDVYQKSDISCPTTGSFYFYVRNNPDGGDHSNVLEFHMTVKKGNISYEGVKTIVCENLVIKKMNIRTASFTKDANYKWVLTDADVSTGNDQSKWKKYYSVWFSRDI